MSEFEVMGHVAIYVDQEDLDRLRDKTGELVYFDGARLPAGDRASVRLEVVRGDVRPAERLDRWQVGVRIVITAATVTDAEEIAAALDGTSIAAGSVGPGVLHIPDPMVDLLSAGEM